MASHKPMAAMRPTSVFDEVAKLVSGITGVQLGERQRSMVETRLKKRMLDLGIETEEKYAEHLHANPESETGALVSLLTTHHTYFFREFSHFETLERKALPALVAAARAKGRKTLRVWSAACSRGQEVYSLSMFLAANLPRIAPDFTYEILGTDVDEESVGIAKNGVYHRNEIKEIPLSLLGNHWARGTGSIADYVKAKPSIKAPCRFDVVNLVNLATDGPKGEFDVIFCRNVFIYFTPEQVKSITQGLISRLSPEGFLFIGISETLNGLGLPVTYEGPSVYALPKAQAPRPPSAPHAPAVANVVPMRPAPEAKTAPLRVLCVDDSPSVIALLKKVLVPEHGFEVVATAGNGIEAAARLREVKVDAMTLDIHMPEQTGLEYLVKNYGPNHPPVVMITSVSRENSDLALQCLKTGAADFIEKPALNNLSERGDEIRTKLTCAIRSRATPAARDLSLDQAFKAKPEIKNPEGAIRAVVASYSSWDSLASTLKEASGNQPPTVVFVEGAPNVLQEYAKTLGAKIGASVEVADASTAALKPRAVYVADFGSAFEPMMERARDKRLSVLVYGGLSAHGTRKLLRFKGKRTQLLAEDPGKAASSDKSGLLSAADDVVPATSFAYMSTQFLSEHHG